ncbi:MAG: hypothetical protein Q8P41_25960 [Pseudomonadota bacterium]|nr:hypothetical protein [Pseudomonadota bacterium]
MSGAPESATGARFAAAPPPSGTSTPAPVGVPVLTTLAPLRLVALPMALGLLAELAGWILVAAAAPLHAGWYGWPALLLGAHLVAIGGLLLPVLGAGWQLTPVVIAAPLPPWALAVAGRTGPAAALGAVLLWAGMGGATAVGAVGATLLIGVLVARSLTVVPLLARARGRVGIRAWLFGAEAALWGGLGYAALLYAGKLGYPVLADPVAGIGHHVGLLAVGWIGGWEVGLGALLLPMFALGHEPRPGPLLVAALLWFGGLAAAAPLVWAAGAGLAVGLLLRSLFGAGRGLATAGPGLVQAGAALLGLLAAALGAALGVVPPHALVAALFTLWLLPFQHGIAARIVPFLLWAHLLAGRAGAPAPGSLVDARMAWAQAAATGLGGLLLVGGLATMNEGVARAGAAALALGSALHLATIAGAAIHVFWAWRAAVALPGTASEVP